MKWLEIIELRSFNMERALLELDISNLVDEICQKEKPLFIKIFSRQTIETDFSIHLYFDSELTDGNGSTLGLHLASILKEYGLVNHNIWVERCCYP